MGSSSIKLFLRGRLFASLPHALGFAFVGMLVTAIAFVVLARVGVPVLAAAPIAAFGGGILQPRLYKNLKYR